MPVKMKNMKGIDLFCASPASTAICSSTDHRSMVRTRTKPLPLIHHPPCNLSQLPFSPRPSSSSSPSVVKHSDVMSLRKKSSADKYNYYITSCNSTKNKNNNNTTNKSSSCYSPPGNSSRYLLGESELFSDSLALVPSTPVTRPDDDYGRRSTSRIETRRFGTLLEAEKEKNKIKTLLPLVNDGDQRLVKPNKHANYDGLGLGISERQHKSMAYRRSDSDSLALKSSASAPCRDQVVVLRVSLHCRGCEAKLRKHLSKMEGVTSFSIDLETKKVTVKGNVTPLGVLTSISKVKNAQLWPSTASVSPSSSSSSSTTSTLDFN